MVPCRSILVDNLRWIISSGTVRSGAPFSNNFISSFHRSYWSRKFLLCPPDRCFLFNREIIFIINSRTIVTSSHLYEKESSKVEQTVNALKEEVNKIQEIEQDIRIIDGKSIESDKKPEVKRGLWKRFKDEVVHYYHGFRLLLIDINILRRLILQVLNGKSLTRREHRQMVRTVSDLFRLVPFSVFIIIPFMEFLLPVFLKFFPGMLPSTFQTEKDKQSKIFAKLKIKIDMAKFLQETLDDMALKSTGESHSNKAKEFMDFFQKVRKSGKEASNEEILKYSKLFEDEITLDSLSRPQLTALCRLLEIQPLGTNNFLRFQLMMKLRSLKADDEVIQMEGLSNLTIPELQQACRARGMRALGVAEERLRNQLKQWLELSLNEKIPPSLLLLSRALYLPDYVPTTDQLKVTISSLPDTVAAEARYRIGETEGKVDNKTKIELIRQEEEAIKKDREEYELIEKEKLLTSENIVDKAKVIFDEVTPTEQQEVKYSQDDFSSLEDAIEEISKERKNLMLEKEELEGIKEEMKDYKEEIEELKEVESITGKKEFKERKGAKRLRKKVNRMIEKLDNVLNELESKRDNLKAKMQEKEREEENAQDVEDSVKISELFETIIKLKKVEDPDKLQNILDALDVMDVDNDGELKLEHVTKVLELLEHEKINITSDQLKEIVKLLVQEEILEEEKKNKIEEIMRIKEETKS